MPSEKSMEKARELVLGGGAILMHGIATALDSAIAETREEDAAWHDAQAKFYDEKAAEHSGRIQLAQNDEFERRAQLHRYSAKAIRATGKESERDWAPETRHERDCAYVTSDGPAPCTCKAINALATRLARGLRHDPSI